MYWRSRRRRDNIRHVHQERMSNCHWWGFISRNYVVWPTFFLMNVFIALKGSHFWFLFTTNYHETDYPYFKNSFKINVSPVDTWISEASVKTFCDKNVRTFDNRFAILHDVILNNSKRISADKNHKGGEHLKDVLGQNEADEFFKCSKGFWSIRCDSNDIQRNRNIHWLEYLDRTSDRKYDTKEITKDVIIDNTVTLAVTRGDYVNLHNAIRQVYNVFLLMVIFKKQPKDISVLLVDGHPAGSLDEPWGDIFR